MSRSRLFSFASSLTQTDRYLAISRRSSPAIPSCLTPLIYIYPSSRPFSVATTTHTQAQTNSNSNIDMEVNDGQVKIHSRQQQEPLKQKTQAELEKEIWQEAHRVACEQNRKKYIDPKTGYTVMTELLHKRRGYCCGNACRHCPYNNENVGVSPEVKRANIKRGKQKRMEIEAIEGKPVWADENSDDAYSD